MAPEERGNAKIKDSLRAAKGRHSAREFASRWGCARCDPISQLRRSVRQLRRPLRQRRPRQRQSPRRRRQPRLPQRAISARRMHEQAQAGGQAGKPPWRRQPPCRWSPSAVKAPQFAAHSAGLPQLPQSRTVLATSWTASAADQPSDSRHRPLTAHDRP